jgi:hypothetical protein
MLIKITFFLFISLPAQSKRNSPLRNEPKTRSAAESHEEQGYSGVIAILSHSAIFRESQKIPSHYPIKFNFEKYLVRPVMLYGNDFG